MLSRMTKQRVARSSRALFLVVFLIVGSHLLSSATAQTFASGSNGSDGALVLTTPGNVNFDPKNFNPPLDPDGDGVYHFTTITIGSGVNVVIDGAAVRGPVYWLAQGAVRIDGTINIAGNSWANGGTVPLDLNRRQPRPPGAGGYWGGIGGNSGALPPQAGGGAGGGLPGNAANPLGQGGRFAGNQFLIPLVGGSGGGGEFVADSGSFGQTGAAGGGAILIASSVSISVGGTINADGGTSQRGGAGSGGAIRLVAPSVVVGGPLTARGRKTNTVQESTDGIVRIEAASPVVNQFGSCIPCSISTSLVAPIVPATTGSNVKVRSIAGIQVNANPFSFPDISINTGSAVPVVIEGRQIPPGTQARLHVFSENGAADQTFTVALQGTLDLTTATVNVTFPTGPSRGYVRATWNQ